MREGLARLAANASCAVPRVTVSDAGRVVVSGLVGAGAADTGLADAVRALVPDAGALTWDTRRVAGPYCDLLDLVRPIVQPGTPPMDLTLADGVTRLKRGDPIRPVIRLPDFPAYVILDYFVSDGGVAHLLPARGKPVRIERANGIAAVREGLEVGPPFGTDMVMAIASSAPLFPAGPVRQDEPARAYLPVLARAIEAAERRGVRLTGRLLAVDTRDR